jgi:hypothetical protein
VAAVIPDPTPVATPAVTSALTGSTRTIDDLAWAMWVGLALVLGGSIAAIAAVGRRTRQRPRG